ncbi:MAG: hydrogenase 4 subunit F, partial [Acidihalobacter sp.]
MSALLLTTFTPLAGALLLALLRRDRLAGWVNVALGALSFAASAVLAWQFAQHDLVAGFGLRVDAFNVFLVVLTSFVGLTTSIFSRP